MKTLNSVGAILSAMQKVGAELGEVPIGNIRRISELNGELSRLEDALAATRAATPGELFAKLGELVSALEAEEVGEWCRVLARSCAADAAGLM